MRWGLSFKILNKHFKQCQFNYKTKSFADHPVPKKKIHSLLIPNAFSSSCDITNHILLLYSNLQILSSLTFSNGKYVSKINVGHCFMFMDLKKI